MTRAYYTQHGFNYGRLGPLVRARTDIKYYGKGCKALKNFAPKPQGPAVKRKGAVYVAEVKDSTKPVRLVKFIFSEIDSYVLEFGDSYIRFYQGTDQVGAPYEIASPYSDAELQDLKFAQLGDVMYIAHPSYRPRKLSRLGATNWTIAEMDNQLGPVLDVNDTDTTITLSGTLTEAGTSTWTASVATFDAGDVGSVWRVAKSDDNTVSGYARMTAFTSATVATFENQNDLTAVTVTATKNWNGAAWSGTQGYPRAVAFHEQRLFWAGTNEKPLSIWGSVSNAAYENYDIDDASADDSPVFDISGRANTIQWLSSNGRFLIAGTFGGLAFADFSSTGDTPIPTVYNGTSYGSSKIQGNQINGVMVYTSSNKKSLYKAEYNDISLQYVALDLNDLSTDFLENSAGYLEIVEQPDVAAILVENGALKVLNYDETQGEGSLPLIGWYSIELQGDIESVAVVPTTGEDRIWVSVKRTIDGATKRYVEYFDISDSDRYLDSSVSYSGVATRTLSGLDHLEGESVQVYGDGAYAGEYEVISGSVTIPDAKSAVEEAFIGLSYEADLEIMPINIPIPQLGGTTMTQKARVNELQLLLYKTLTLKVGSSFDDLKSVPFRSTADDMDEAPPIFGNDYPDIKQDVPYTQNWLRQPTVCIRSDLPFPCTIVGLTARMEIESN